MKTLVMVVMAGLVALAATLVPATDAAGKGHKKKRPPAHAQEVRKKKRAPYDGAVPVYDYSGDPLVEAEVRTFNAAIPGRTHLVYKKRPVATCAQMRKDMPPAPYIVICPNKISMADSAASSSYGMDPRAIIYLNTRYPLAAGTICHELMHAVARIPDDYAKMGSPEWADQSCVWGVRTDPGPFDLDYLRRMYA